MKIFLHKCNDSFSTFHKKREKDKNFYRRRMESGNTGANATNFDVGAQQLGFLIPKKA